MATFLTGRQDSVLYPSLLNLFLSIAASDEQKTCTNTCARYRKIADTKPHVSIALNINKQLNYLSETDSSRIQVPRSTLFNKPLPLERHLKITGLILNSRHWHSQSSPTLSILKFPVGYRHSWSTLRHHFQTAERIIKFNIQAVHKSYNQLPYNT